MPCLARTLCDWYPYGLCRGPARRTFRLLAISPVIDGEVGCGGSWRGGRPKVHGRAAITV